MNLIYCIFFFYFSLTAKRLQTQCIFSDICGADATFGGDPVTSVFSWDYDFTGLFSGKRVVLVVNQPIELFLAHFLRFQIVQFVRNLCNYLGKNGWIDRLAIQKEVQSRCQLIRFADN